MLPLQLLDKIPLLPDIPRRFVSLLFLSAILVVAVAMLPAVMVLDQIAPDSDGVTARKIVRLIVRIVKVAKLALFGRWYEAKSLVLIEDP